MVEELTVEHSTVLSNLYAITKFPSQLTAGEYKRLVDEWAEFTRTTMDAIKRIKIK